MSTPSYRLEKTQSIIENACYMLIAFKKRDELEDIRGGLHPILWDSTKLYCQAAESVSGNENSTWSPELPDYLFDHPEKCAETLAIVASADYHDQYYVK